MYKLDVGVDTREAAAIERRKNMEKQRQSRIFNARERTIGVDIVSLDQQIKECKEKEEMEKQFHNAFASEMIRNDKIAEIIQQRQIKDKQQLNKSLLDYRHEHQRLQDRKEFDLNDPESKTKELPARVSDDDTSMSTSGMQIFLGEDLQHEERKKYQKEQMREWVREQITEKSRLSMEQKKSDDLYNKKAVEMDLRTVELSISDAETRKDINFAIAEYNKALAKEKSAQTQQELVNEQDDNFTELSNHIHGDILTENPQVSESAFGPHRVIPDRWKGMSPSQVSSVLRTQEMQCREKQRLKEEEEKVEREWERRRLAEARAGLVRENQIVREREELRKQIANENKKISAEQRARHDVLNEEVYINPPTEEYFSQFGTSSR